MVKKYVSFWIIAIALALTIIGVNPATLPVLPKIKLETFKLDSNLKDAVISACVRLDGRCVFELSDRKSNLAQRIKYTEERLANIKKSYLQNNRALLEVYERADNNRQNIYVTLGNQEFLVLTLDERDASIHGVKLDHHAQQIANKIKRGLERTRQERQSSFLLKQVKIAAGIMLSILLANWLLFIWLKRLKREKANLTTDNNAESIARNLEHRTKKQNNVI